jgi:hypothetical protein
MFNYVPIKHKQMSFVSNGGKFKLYTVLNGLIFSCKASSQIIYIFTILSLFNVISRLSFDRQLMLLCHTKRLLQQAQQAYLEDLSSWTIATHLDLVIQSSYWIYCSKNVNSKGTTKRIAPGCWCSAFYIVYS